MQEFSSHILLLTTSEVGQFQTGDVLVLDATRCPACKANLGKRDWDLACGQRTHFIHVQSSEMRNIPTGNYIKSPGSFMDAKTFPMLVRQCRYHGTQSKHAHQPVQGPFHNAVFEIRNANTNDHVWRETQVPDTPEEPQFATDDFLLANPAVKCPKCKLILNSIKVLHGQYKTDQSNNGKWFVFDSDLSIPQGQPFNVRLCRYQDTNHINHNKVFLVEVWNDRTWADSGRTGRRFGRRDPYDLRAPGDWRGGDILLLDSQVPCPSHEHGISWNAECPS